MRDFEVIKYCYRANHAIKEYVYGYIVKYEDCYYFIYDLPERKLTDNDTSWIFDIEKKWIFDEIEATMNFYENEYTFVKIDISKLLNGDKI